MHPFWDGALIKLHFESTSGYADIGSLKTTGRNAKCWPRQFLIFTHRLRKKQEEARKDNVNFLLMDCVYHTVKNSTELWE